MSQSSLVVKGKLSFVSKPSRKRFEQHKSFDLHAERQVCPSLDSELQIHSLFETLGWERILHLDTTSYPELVAEFYADMTFPERYNSPILESLVHGVRIRLTPTVLGDILEVDGSITYIGIDRKNKVNDANFPGLDRECEILKRPYTPETYN